jgi:aspartokinase
MKVKLIDNLAAISLIGAGINQTFQNLRQFVSILDELAIQPTGIHTSSFRITALIPAEKIKQAVQRMHHEFIDSN